MARLDLRARKAPKAVRDQLELKVLRVRQGRKVLRELMVRLDRRGIRVTLAHRVRKVRAAD